MSDAFLADTVDMTIDYSLVVQRLRCSVHGMISYPAYTCVAEALFLRNIADLSRLMDVQYILNISDSVIV